MSENIQVTLKSENEINKQEVETLKDVLTQADIADNAVIMLKEMEKEQDEAKIKALQEKSQEKKEEYDPFHQKEIQDANSHFSTANNTLAPLEQSEKLKHIVKPFRIIFSRASNHLTFVDALIEYKKTGDGLKVTLKIGATIIADKIFQIGVVASVGIAITAFIATAIAGVSVAGAIVVGITIFIGAVTASYWISKQAEKYINNFANLIIDFIREADFYFTEEEMRQLSVAHCHKTTQRIMQRFSGNDNQKGVFINGIDVTDKLYPNPYILPDKAIIPKGFSNTWRNLTAKQLKELNDTIKISEETK